MDSDQNEVGSEGDPGHGPTQQELPNDPAALLLGLHQSQSILTQSVQDLGGQGAFLRQQVIQLYDAVRQLYGAVAAQSTQLAQDHEGIREEFRRFQTGAPQRAMTGVYAKLFRDLLKQMNQLDDLVRLGESGAHEDCEKPWIEAVRVARDSLETTLLEWGCAPIAVRVGEDEFDPEIHEAVAGEAFPSHGATGSGRVAGVVRRGWQIAGIVLQHPQVIVS